MCLINEQDEVYSWAEINNKKRIKNNQDARLETRETQDEESKKTETRWAIMTTENQTTIRNPERDSIR